MILVTVLFKVHWRWIDPFLFLATHILKYQIIPVFAGFEAGAEAAIHAMKELYEEENSEAVIMIDASNAFNSMNRAVALKYIQVLCPTIATYLINTYRQPSRLFVIGGGELKSTPED